MAAVGCGLYESVDEACSSLINITDITEQIKKDVEKYNEIYKVYVSLYSCLKNTFKELSKLNL